MKSVINLSRKVIKILLISCLIPKHLILLGIELEALHFKAVRKIKTGKGCIIDKQTWLINGENIVLGNYVKISAFSTIMAGYKSNITIGNHTIIGPSVLITSFNHGFRRKDIPIRYQKWEENEDTSIEIGNDVWIGGNVTILPGTKIGNGAIIAAGTIVKGKVPKDTICLNKKEIRHVERF